jgi:uncharacterized protein YndB with AHSA1/START domain
VNNNDFVFVTCIASTPDRVWDALTQGELTRRYWSHDNVSDWIAGSRWEHRRLDRQRTVDLAGIVLESSPPERLVMTWARPYEADDVEKGSRVTFDIRPEADQVRLTVRHAAFATARERAEQSRDWPCILLSLKTLLEQETPTRTAA